MNLLHSVSVFYLFLVTLYQTGLIVAVDSTENELTSSAELSISERIFGGQTVFQQDDFSYVAKLQISYSRGSSAVCSGVVLTTKIVLTVAQCVSRPGEPKAQSVVVTLPSGGRYTFLREEIFIPTNYIGLFGANVAILKKNIMSSQYMRGVSSYPWLPLPNEAYWGDQAVVVGWGRTDNNGAYTTKLQYANVRITTQTKCETEYNLEKLTLYAGEVLYCTYKNIAGTCDGDWGGPLLVTKNRITTLVGLSTTRRGRECDGSSDKPSAYFALKTEMIDWIQNNFKV